MKFAARSIVTRLPSSYSELSIPTGKAVLDYVAQQKNMEFLYAGTLWTPPTSNTKLNGYPLDYYLIVSAASAQPTYSDLTMSIKYDDGSKTEVTGTAFICQIFQNHENQDYYDPSKFTATGIVMKVNTHYQTIATSEFFNITAATGQMASVGSHSAGIVAGKMKVYKLKI